MPRDIRHDEQQIAELLDDTLRAAAASPSLSAIAAFSSAISSSALARTGVEARPVEPDLGRALLQLDGARESRERERHVIEPRGGRRRAALGLLLVLDALPHVVGEERIAARVGEHMRVPADHLAGDRIDHVGEAEAVDPPTPSARGKRPGAGGRRARPSARRDRRARSRRRPRKLPRSCTARWSRRSARRPTGSPCPCRAGAP